MRSDQPKKGLLNGTARAPQAPLKGSPRPLHRLRAARLQQGVSLRSAARRLNQTLSQTRTEEDEHTDVPLSTLCRWQRALEVPITELLCEADGALSEPILQRATMLKLMKTARAILQERSSPQTHRLALRLIDQLTEIMPELEHVSAWPPAGRRARLERIGRIAENPLPERLLIDPGEGTTA
jgi:transcriptional regulator with XRE-family HTH domain